MEPNKKSYAVLYGLLAGAGLLGFFVSVLTIFQGFQFALLNLRSLWYWIFPLAAGFGTQIGLYASIRHTATISKEIAATGTVSGGSMVACCSHFLLNIVPLVGFSALATTLMGYQTYFFAIGLVSNVAGIGLLWNHRNKMTKGEKCH